MYKKKQINTQNVRLMSVEEAATYMGLGRTAFREYAVKIGADRHIGRRVLYDKHVLDKAIDDMVLTAVTD